MKVNFAHKTVGSFDYEFTRGVSTQGVGTAEFGDCMETIFRTHPALPRDRFTHMLSQREGASSHRQMGGLSCAHSTIFAWLNHVLHGSPLPEAADASIKQEVIELFRKSGGKEASLGAISLLQQAHLV